MSQNEWFFITREMGHMPRTVTLTLTLHWFKTFACFKVTVDECFTCSVTVFEAKGLSRGFGKMVSPKLAFQCYTLDNCGTSFTFISVLLSGFLCNFLLNEITPVCELKTWGYKNSSSVVRGVLKGCFRWFLGICIIKPWSCKQSGVMWNCASLQKLTQTYRKSNIQHLKASFLGQLVA